MAHSQKAAPSLFHRIFSSQATGGTILMGAALFALLAANSQLSPAYATLLKLQVGPMSLEHWVNDGLMAIFFLLVGLEIKREVLGGELSTWQQRILPGAAALGGMFVPALIYFALNAGPTGEPRGWAIPSATDIAFALGVLSLLGPRIPPALKVFLAALAIIDDLGAVIIIALFYSGSFNLAALAAVALIMVLLAGLNRAGVKALWPYLVFGLVLWCVVFLSGLHATLAGVLLSLTIPASVGETDRSGHSTPLVKLEHALGPLVIFLILPLFGFANAGVSLGGMSVATIIQPVPIGVMAGLFFGKQVGVFTAAIFVIRMGWSRLPALTSWSQLYGVAMLCGIGFTMSIFIGLLAFPDDSGNLDQVKLGVLLGSACSAILGGALLAGASSGLSKFAIRAAIMAPVIGLGCVLLWYFIQTVGAYPA